MKAVYDYAASNDDELTLAEGAVVDVFDITEDDWIFVHHNGAYGYVPSSYLENVI